MIEGFLRFADGLSEWVGKVVSFFILAVALVIGYEVVMRYLFNNPTRWAHETSIMFFGACIILGGAYTLHHNTHVSMDLIYGRLSVRKKAILDVTTFVLFALFCVVLVWWGGRSAWGSLLSLERASTVWGPPIYPFKLMLPIGAFLLLLQGLAKFVRDIVTLRVGGVR